MSFTSSGLARSRRAEHRTVRLELARSTLSLLVLAVLASWTVAFALGAWWSGGEATFISSVSPPPRSPPSSPQTSPPHVFVPGAGEPSATRETSPPHVFEDAEDARKEVPHVFDEGRRDSGDQDGPGGATGTETTGAAHVFGEGDSDRPVPGEGSSKDRRLVEVPPRGRWGLQLGAFESLSEALAFLERLKDPDLPQYVTAVDLDEKGTWYRVRVGAFRTKGSAIRLRSELRSLVPDEPLVVRYE